MTAILKGMIQRIKWGIIRGIGGWVSERRYGALIHQGDYNERTVGVVAADISRCSVDVVVESINAKGGKSVSSTTVYYDNGVEAIKGLKRIVEAHAGPAAVDSNAYYSHRQKTYGEFRLDRVEILGGSPIEAGQARIEYKAVLQALGT